MTLVAATLPDDPAAVPGWLDAQLVGDRLGDLVAELLALNPAATTDAGADLIAPHRADLLARGTAALPASVCRELLRRPAALLAVQELVLLEGGPYWDAVPRPAALTAAVERARLALRAAVPTVPLVPVAGRGWRREAVRWAASFAVAAAVLVAVVGLWGRPAAGEVAWGWARPGGLPTDAAPRAYYRALAATAREWYDARPGDAPAVARRVADFRRGCTALILADHRPLPAERAADLRDRCRKWAAGLDAALADLEAGRDPSAVRAVVDAVVDKLVTYLEAQGESV